jgi:hypothetical protein
MATKLKEVILAKTKEFKAILRFWNKPKLESKPAQLELVFNVVANVDNMINTYPVQVLFDVWLKKDKTDGGVWSYKENYYWFTIRGHKANSEDTYQSRYAFIPKDLKDILNERISAELLKAGLIHDPESAPEEPVESTPAEDIPTNDDEEIPTF